MVSASDLGPEGLEFEPWPVHPRCVLRQNNSHSASLHPGVTCDGLVSHPAGVEILLVVSYYNDWR